MQAKKSQHSKNNISINCLQRDSKPVTPKSSKASKIVSKSSNRKRGNNISDSLELKNRGRKPTEVMQFALGCQSCAQFRQQIKTMNSQLQKQKLEAKTATFLRAQSQAELIKLSELLQQKQLMVAYLRKRVKLLEGDKENRQQSQQQKKSIPSFKKRQPPAEVQDRSVSFCRQDSEYLRLHQQFIESVGKFSDEEEEAAVSYEVKSQELPKEKVKRRRGEERKQPSSRREQKPR